MKLTHVVIAGAALVSFSAIAADEAKKDQQAQSGSQTQSQSAQSSSEKDQSASGGATQQQGAKAGGQQMSQDKELVKQAQEKLSAAGHDVGTADGIMGPKTQKGLKEFQQSKGLQPSGQLDQKTLSALGVSGDASASTGASADKSEKEASGSASGGASSSGSASPASSEKSSGEKSK